MYLVHFEVEHVDTGIINRKMGLICDDFFAKVPSKIQD